MTKKKEDKFLTVKLSGMSRKFVSQVMDFCGCPPERVIENLIVGAIARATAGREMFPDDIIATIVPDLRTIDGKLFEADEIYSLILEERKAELFVFKDYTRLQQEVDDIFLHESEPQGNA